MKASEMKKLTLITEGWNDSRLTLLESQHIIPFVKSIENYVTEAQLTPDQIKQLFTSVEQGATAAGGNRTAIGKGKDAADAVDSAVKGAGRAGVNAIKGAAGFIDGKINELGKALKQAGPVKNIDQKFNELKAKIGEKDSKVVNAVKAVSDWAKENPGKATIAVAILTTAASMAGGPLGGAIAGFLARATKDLLQGKDLSSAVGSSLKTAAYGAIAGWALNGLGDWLEGLRADAVPFDKVPGLTQVDVGMVKTLSGPGFKNVQTLGSMIVPADQVDQFTNLVQAAQGGNVGAFNQLWSFSKSFDINEFNELRNATQDLVQMVAQQNDTFLQNLTLANDAIAAIAQGSVQASGKKAEFKVGDEEVTPETSSENPKESKTLTAKEMKIVFEWCVGTPQVLNEGPMDALKKAGSAIVGKAKTVGKNITTKVTADKLMTAWKKAGSPTDSDAIADVLRSAGVRDDVIAPVYKTMSVPFTAKPAADPAADGKIEPTLDPAAAPAASDAPAAGNAPAASDAPAAGNAAGSPTPMDFKTLQKTVSSLSAQDAKALLTYIDSLKGAAPAAAQTAPAGAPAAGSETPATPGQEPAAAADKNAAGSDTFEKAKGDIRKVQSGTKPMPPKTAAEIDAALAKLAKGDKESGVFAAQKIMNFAKAGVDVSKQQQAWVANAKAGERFLTQSVYFEITKMLREHKLSWSDLGIRVHLLEGTNKLFGISFK